MLGVGWAGVIAADVAAGQRLALRATIDTATDKAPQSR